MTETQKQQMNSKMRRLCRKALLALAEKHDLKVTTSFDHYRIVGPDGYISERPHGDDFHTNFEPGYGRAEDWKRLFKGGVVLAWVDTCYFKTGDNFRPTDDEGDRMTVEMFGINQPFHRTQ
jgi:hypothetical protein